MPNLKIHVILGKEIQAEGEEEVVLKLVDRFIQHSPETSVDNLTMHPQHIDHASTSITLHEAVLLDKAENEAEWLVLYAQYLQQREFERVDLLRMYKETARYSENRRKNLSFYIKTCVKRGWFNLISADKYSLSPQGQEQAKIILER